MLQEEGFARRVRVLFCDLLIDVRWSGGDLKRLRRDAAESVALSPDVLVASVGPTPQTLLQATCTIPICDIVPKASIRSGGGFVRSMA